MTNRYDNPAQATFVNDVLPLPFQQMMLVGNELNQRVKDAENEMREFYKQHIDFQSPSIRDTQDYYNESIGYLKPFVDKAAQNFEWLKTPEGRSELSSAINKAPYAKLSAIRQSRDNMLERKRMEQELALKGQYNPLWHEFDYTNYSTLDRDIMNDFDLLPYQGIKELTNQFYDNMKDSFLGRSGGREYFGVSGEMLDKATQQHVNTFLNSQYGQKYLDVYMNKLGMTREEASQRIAQEMRQGAQEFERMDSRIDPVWQLNQTLAARKAASGSGSDDDPESRRIATAYDWRRNAAQRLQAELLNERANTQIPAGSSTQASLVKWADNVLSLSDKEAGGNKVLARQLKQIMRGGDVDGPTGQQLQNPTYMEVIGLINSAVDNKQMTEKEATAAQKDIISRMAMSTANDVYNDAQKRALQGDPTAADLIDRLSLIGDDSKFVYNHIAPNSTVQYITNKDGGDAVPVVSFDPKGSDFKIQTKAGIVPADVATAFLDGVTKIEPEKKYDVRGHSSTVMAGAPVKDAQQVDSKFVDIAGYMSRNLPRVNGSAGTRTFIYGDQSQLRSDMEAYVSEKDLKKVLKQMKKDLNIDMSENNLIQWLSGKSGPERQMFEKLDGKNGITTDGTTKPEKAETMYKIYGSVNVDDRFGSNVGGGNIQGVFTNLADGASEYTSQAKQAVVESMESLSHNINPFYLPNYSSKYNP